MDRHELVPADEALVSLEEQVRFYIHTPERAGEALRFVKKLKEFSENIEKSVKDRSWKIMERDGLREISYGEYVAKLNEPVDMKVYKPSSVLNAFGDEYIDELMSVSTPKVMAFLKKYKVEGPQLDALNVNMETKTRSGFISVSEKKGL